MRIRKAIDMRIQSKQELKEIVAYERALWIKRMYPNGCQHNIRNHTLTYMKALRIVEYYSSQSKFQRVWGGGVLLLEIDLQSSGINNKCFHPTICL